MEKSANVDSTGQVGAGLRVQQEETASHLGLRHRAPEPQRRDQSEDSVDGREGKESPGKVHISSF